MIGLSEELFNKIMVYVSHPCADMVNNCKMTRFDNVEIMKTSIKKYLILKFGLVEFSVLVIIQMKN
jgi:hypothetical protein